MESGDAPYSERKSGKKELQWISNAYNLQKKIIQSQTW